MTTDTQETIKQSLDFWINPESYIDEMSSNWSEGEKTQALQEAVNERVLCIDVEVHKQVMLGVGGPTVYFDIVFVDGEAVRGKFIDTGAKYTEIALSDSELQQVLDMFYLNY